MQDFGIEDEEIGGVKVPQASGAAGRHSESKKEMLKVIENNINRLMKERVDLDKISRKFEDVEAQAVRTLL